MTRTAALSIALRKIALLNADGAVQFCEREYEHTGDPYLLALASFAVSIGQKFSDSADFAARAMSESVDAEARLFAQAATSWMLTTVPDSAAPDPLESVLDNWRDFDDVPGESRVFIKYLFAEAALGSARLDLATTIVERSGPLPSDFLRTAEAHPYLPVMQVMRARLLGFQGRITDALGALDEMRPAAGTAVEFIVAAVRCLLSGNNAQRGATRTLANRLELELGEPTDYLSAGCYLLVSYGLVATGDTARASTFVLRAGRTAGLDVLNIIDRALGLEMLVSAAALELDLDAARAWQVRAEPLLENRIARPTIERIMSRIELLAGDAGLSAAWAEKAIDSAKIDGRAIEVAEAEILLSRANIALSERGLAATRLEAMATQAASSGHFAAQKSAARELRAIGRRLPPLAGSGWNGLSDREREVAVLIAEGFSNQLIASRLHLSLHTVQAHVSRVLAAFGAASRFSVAATLAPVLSTSLSPALSTAAAESELPPLTARQQTVAAHIAEGRRDKAIATELGVSVKTIEKHVSEILRRWQVASRSDIARLSRARVNKPKPH